MWESQIRSTIDCWNLFGSEPGGLHLNAGYGRRMDEPIKSVSTYLSCFGSRSETNVARIAVSNIGFVANTDLNHVALTFVTITVNQN
ncbi:hypothetical protein T06_6189 [Trichinella sp. T6]|nr:hypothetical protein T06_6189 [Trichinella sp. T6]